MLAFAARFYLYDFALVGGVGKILNSLGLIGLIEAGVVLVFGQFVDWFVLTLQLWRT